MKHKSFEMKFLVSCVTLNLLFLANIVSSQMLLVDTTNYDSNVTDTNGQRIQFYEIRSPLQLSCNVTRDADSIKIEWRKENVNVNEISELKERTHFPSKGKIVIEKAEVQDSGNYSCVALRGDKVEESLSFITSAKPAVKLPTNLNVVEGEKLVLSCTVLGDPATAVTWKMGDMVLNDTDGRISYGTDPDSKIKNTILNIDDVDLKDRGTYSCIARSHYSESIFKERSIMVRVKGKLAALWPFLGICAEVFVLCAIILVYEKKRNKTELDESDTDQSPEQKNTPDHGKESDVRHRK